MTQIQFEVGQLSEFFIVLLPVCHNLDYLQGSGMHEYKETVSRGDMGSFRNVLSNEWLGLSI